MVQVQRFERLPCPPRRNRRDFRISRCLSFPFPFPFLFVIVASVVDPSPQSKSRDSPPPTHRTKSINPQTLTCSSIERVCLFFSSLFSFSFRALTNDRMLNERHTTQLPPKETPKSSPMSKYPPLSCQRSRRTTSPSKRRGRIICASRISSTSPFTLRTAKRSL